MRKYEKSKNVICFDCDEKKHYVNECSNSRKLKKMKSSFITTQIILSSRDKHDNLAKCVLSNQVVIVTIRSEEIRKKKITIQAKKKKIILKKNERINKEHDKYLKQQEQEQEQKRSKSSKDEMSLEETKDVKKMSKINQSKEFHEFDDESNNEEMMKYSNESITISQKQTSRNKKQNNIKIKMIREQMKKLMTLKKLKISNSIRVMKNRSRFDVQNMMNLMMSLSIKQLLNENQQLRKKFAWNLQLSISRYRIKKTITKLTVLVEETMSNAMMKALRMTTKALKNDDEMTSIFIIIWIENIQINWFLIDNDSVIEMINKRLMIKILKLKIRHDENLSMTLITNLRITWRDYVWIFINCQRVEIYMKTYVCSITVYDLLLSLRWQKRVQMKINMRRETLSIIETNERKRMLQFKLTSIDVLKQMLIIKIEKEFDEEKILQAIFDEDVEKKAKKKRWRTKRFVSAKRKA